MTDKKIINAEIIYTTIQNQIENFPSTPEELLKIFKLNKIISVIYEDMKLNEGCNELLEMMNKTKPEREKKGIQTWFTYEESK